MGIKRIGIVGGGQLGLMIGEAAEALGYESVSLDPAVDAPSRAVCVDHIVAAYDDEQALEHLCEMTDVVTYEFENIPAAVIEPLCERYNVPQGCAPLLDSQDRLFEKQNAVRSGLRTPKFAAVDGGESLFAAIEQMGLPAVLKTRRMGYDGRGQMVIRTMEDARVAAEQITSPSILEEFVQFDYEVSTVVVRSKDDSVVFPIGRNIHKRGVLDLCVVPAAISDEFRERVERGSLAFMEQCGYYGILAIEYFVKGDEVIFNEMAPRPHNSGHYTIEGCDGGSQFSQLVRYLVGEPFDTVSLAAESVIMKNILGEDMAVAQQIAAECESGEHEGCYVHLYGKSECKVGRKMGHITFVGLSEAEYYERWASRFAD
ncbi:MAG: 5-(carboxyamino)imidazole ribonucleotide synthase [Rikenellaceae bacterium]